MYADYIANSGVRQVIEIINEDIYWTSGAEAIRRRLSSAGIRIHRVPLSATKTADMTADQVIAAATRVSPSIALLLVGYPEPLGAIVQAVSNRNELGSNLTIGDPAGRAIFPDWWETAGDAGAGVGYLSYDAPKQRTALGQRVVAAFAERHGRIPSFVALEGYDAIVVAANALTHGPDQSASGLALSLAATDVQGTRGAIRFATEPEGVVHQQWALAPLCVAARGIANSFITDARVLWSPQA